MTNYFEQSPGNKSSSRLTGFIVIMYALLLSTQVLILGFISGAPIIIAASAAGTMFTTHAGPAMAYMFLKGREEKSKQNE